MLHCSKGKFFPLVCILCALVLLVAAFGTACAPAEPETVPPAPADTVELSVETADEPKTEPVELSLALPAEAQAGDLLVAEICCGGKTNFSVEASSGWNLVMRTVNEAGVGMTSFYKVIQDPSTEPAIYPFQITAENADGGQTQASGKILVCHGIDAATPVSIAGSETGSGTDLTAPSFETQAPVLVITLFGITGNNDGLTASGDTEGLQTLFNELADGGFVLYASQQAFDSGVVGNQTVTAGQSGNWAVQMIAFRFAPTEITFLAGDHGSLTAERLAVVKLSAVRHIAFEQIPQVIANPGYAFTGWLPYDGEKALSSEEVSKLALSSDTVFAAQYQKTTYTIRFELGEHGVSKDPLVLRNLNYGDAVNTPNVTANAGWTFDGWDAVPSATAKGDATYTAQYTKADYTVTFVLGEHGSSTDTLLFTGLVAGDDISVPDVTPDEGWTFDGWDTTPETTVSGSATYTAQYSPVTYTITFNLDGKGTSEDTLELTGLAIGDPISVPIVVANPGWRFIGWNAEIPDAVEGNATFTALYDVFRPK